MVRKRERDDVYAVEGGTVLYALKTKSEYGYRIYIRHVDGSTAMYGHLESFNIKAGDVVESKDFIGTMGETGNCPSGKHLHINYFGKYALSLTGKDTSDPTFWIMLSDSWPTNTKCSGGYHAVYTDSEDNEYLHEGFDLSYTHLIAGWEHGNINAMIQDMRIAK